MMNRHVICALDTADLNEAIATVGRLKDHVSAFKVGHALTLPNGLDVLDRLRDAGAARIFLDLKFHDIPNSVALAVREAARRGVWMMTLHISGGPAMLTAAIEQARSFGEANRPLLVGVSVLTSLDDHILNQMGITRGVTEQMVSLSKLAIDHEMDGVVCSPNEVKILRETIGQHAVIVTPGIRLPNAELHDQKRVGDPNQALDDGADYLVVGRALTAASDPDAALSHFGMMKA